MDEDDLIIKARGSGRFIFAALTEQRPPIDHTLAHAGGRHSVAAMALMEQRPPALGA